jgi:hypothetical protein
MEMTTLVLADAITLHYRNNRPGSAIVCDEMEVCPSCSDPFCCNDCDGAQGADPDNEETEEDARSRLETNCRIEGTLSLLQNLHALNALPPLTPLNSAIANTFDDIGNRE